MGPGFLHSFLVETLLADYQISMCDHYLIRQIYFAYAFSQKFVFDYNIVWTHRSTVSDIYHK